MNRLGDQAVFIQLQCHHISHLGVDGIGHRQTLGLQGHHDSLMGQTEAIKTIGIRNTSGTLVLIVPLAIQVVVDTAIKIAVCDIHIIGIFILIRKAMDLITYAQFGVLTLMVIIQGTYIHELCIIGKINGLFLAGVRFKGSNRLAINGGNQHIADGDAALTFFRFLGMDRLGAVAVLVYHQAQNPGHLGIDVVCHLLAAGLDSHLLALMGHTEHIISVGIGHSGGFFLGIAPLAFQIIVNTRLQITVYHIDGADLSVHIILGIDLVANLQGGGLACIVCKELGGVIDLYILGKGSCQYLGLSADALGKADGDLVALDLIHIVPGAEIAATVHIVGGDHIQNFLILAQLHTPESGGIQHIDLVQILRPAGKYLAVTSQLNMVDTLGIGLATGFLGAGHIIKVPAEAIFVLAYPAGNKDIAQLAAVIRQAVDLVTGTKLCILAPSAHGSSIDDLAVFCQQTLVFRTDTGTGELLGKQLISLNLHYTGVAAKNIALGHLLGQGRFDHIAILVKGQTHAGGIVAVHLAGDLIVTGSDRYRFAIAQHFVGITARFIHRTGTALGRIVKLPGYIPVKGTGLSVATGIHAEYFPVFIHDHRDLVVALDRTGNTAGDALRGHIIYGGILFQGKHHIIATQGHRGVAGDNTVFHIGHIELVGNHATGKFSYLSVVHHNAVFVEHQSDYFLHINGICQFQIGNRNTLLLAVHGKGDVKVSVIIFIADGLPGAVGLSVSIPVKLRLQGRLSFFRLLGFLEFCSLRGCFFLGKGQQGCGYTQHRHQTNAGDPK